MKINTIQISKDILGGTPVFRGTRVPVQSLIDYLESGDTANDFLHNFPSVTRKQVMIEDHPIFPKDLILAKFLWAQDSLSEMQLNDVRHVLEREDLDRNYLNAGLRN